MAELPQTERRLIDGPRVAPLSGREARSMVILAHGYGSNGEDLIGLAPHWREALPDTAFVAPNAPEPCADAPGGYQWWPVWNPDRAAGVRGAAAVLDAFIDTELARYGLSEDRLARSVSAREPCWPSTSRLAEKGSWLASSAIPAC